MRSLERSPKAFSLVEIMIVVSIIGIMLAVAVPSWLRARETSHRRACQETLSKIDGAKEQWAIESNQPVGANAEWTDLVGGDLYIRRSPVCPMAGTYAIESVGTDPSCSLSLQYGHQLP